MLELVRVTRVEMQVEMEYTNQLMVAQIGI